MSQFAEAYNRGLSDLLELGESVPSVKDPLSTASGFGTANRPSREILNYSFEVDHSVDSLEIPDVAPILFHFPYMAALIAWSLDGRKDVATLEHYRPAAGQYSDDGLNLCGAFGERMFARPSPGDGQLDSVLQRLRMDPSSRRTFVPILEPRDNTTSSLEHPCASGIQLFVRRGKLHMWVVMRAQQALTVLPYDYVLFAFIHLYLAGKLGLTAGRYIHTAGTFHIYESELELASHVLGNRAQLLVPTGIGDADAFKRDLVGTEQRLRTSFMNGVHADVVAEEGTKHPSPALQYWTTKLREFADSTTSSTDALYKAF